MAMAGKTKKHKTPPRIKEKRELVPLVGESYLTHSSSNVTCMQIMRSNNNRRSETSITSILANAIFLSILKYLQKLKIFTKTSPDSSRPKVYDLDVLTFYT
jgi:hypothetical protein